MASSGPKKGPATVLFFPESAHGPTNQCIGVGRVLQQRGHRVVFAAEASWKGKLIALGFKEELVDLSPPPPEEDATAQDAAGQFWIDFVRETAPEFRKPTLEQLETFIQPTWKALIDGAMYCEPRLREIISRVKPDVIVEDNVVIFPALITAGVPFVRIVSCQPLEVRGHGGGGAATLPPPYSGLPTDSSSSPEAEEFRRAYERTHREMWSAFNKWATEQGAPPLPDLEFMPQEGCALNLYIYPEALDYDDVAPPLGPLWHRLESSVRETDNSFEVPPQLLKDRPEGSALIYLSLGSLGSADVGLMQRLVEVMGKTRHRFIVSMGPRAEQYRLADNMWGASSVPQTRVMPLVDLCITHGGNNTTTEAMHFGKPMVLLPLFWDQYDNAQRVHEKGFGVRLPTYEFSDEQMNAAIEKLLADSELKERLKRVSSAVQAARGVERAAELIEGVLWHEARP